MSRNTRIVIGQQSQSAVQKGEREASVRNKGELRTLRLPRPAATAWHLGQYALGRQLG